MVNTKGGVETKATEGEKKHASEQGTSQGTILSRMLTETATCQSAVWRRSHNSEEQPAETLEAKSSLDFTDSRTHARALACGTNISALIAAGDSWLFKLSSCRHTVCSSHQSHELQYSSVPVSARVISL